jgi:hypothetical protein
MRPSLRFLSLVVIGWAGLRAVTLGALPGAEVFRITPSDARPPPIVATQFPPLDPIPPAIPLDGSAQIVPAGYSAAAPAIGRTVMVPVYYAPQAAVPEAHRSGAALADLLPEPRAPFYSAIPVLDEWPLSRIAATSMPPLRSNVVAPAQSLPAALARNRVDRVQLTAWAMLRPEQGGVAGSRSLAAGGSLGGSQAGARLIYNFTQQIAASLRTSSDVGRRGGEVAAGVRVQPVLGIPVWLTAERRQRIGSTGDGRNAFALFFEAGVYDRPMPWRFRIDSYLQGGVVGLRSRDKFIDGGLTLTRPVYKQFSAGMGVWGGAQPGLYRVDAGPRVTMRVRGTMRVDFDWRQRLAGNARPGSGPAVTLAGDF